MSHRMIPTPLDGDPVEKGALWLCTVPPSLNNIFFNVKRKGRIADDRNVIEIHAAFGPVKGTLIEIWSASQSIPAADLTRIAA